MENNIGQISSNAIMNIDGRFTKEKVFEVLSNPDLRFMENFKNNEEAISYIENKLNVLCQLSLIGKTDAYYYSIRNNVEKKSNNSVKTENKKDIESILIFFENCESVSVNVEDIETMNFNGITSEMNFVNGGMNSKKIAKQTIVRLKPSANVQCSNFNTPIFKRVKDYNDICLFQINYKDGTKETMYVSYIIDKNTQHDNWNQQSKILKDGSMLILIDKKRNIKQISSDLNAWL